VTGNGISNSLLFAADTRTHLEDYASFQDNLSLVYQGPGVLKAQQLRLVLKGNGTSGLILQGVTRGADLPAGTFNFATQIHYASVPNSDGTTDDTVSIVWYGNGNNSIAPGTYNDLIRFRYGVGHVSPNGQQTVHVEILDLASSHPNGDPVAVSADAPQNVVINPRGIGGFLYGDVDTNHTVDIADLTAVVDYILGRNPSPFVFALGDLAPWTAPNPAPSPDGVINVQDLSLLQQIILTGQYPDGSPSFRPNVIAPPVVARSGKGDKGGNTLTELTPGKDAKLTFYISNQGISVRMESIVKVKGVQLEFDGVPSVPSTMEVTTPLGLGPFYNYDNMLRVLLYNREANVVEPGDFMVSQMPFGIINPQGVTVRRTIIVGERNNHIENIEIEVIYGDAPELPLDYVLYQNYPNPFNPETNVKFSVPKTSDVTVAVYDMLGKYVTTLFQGKMDRGTKVVNWDGRNSKGALSATGMYIVRMTSGFFQQSRKMAFVK
jgi:hypothetical protein